ncbi:hypothetical protein SYNTR_2293 [Candidatus Syntrophocurvum alkaliphilum]|uniref:Histidine kinase domain-containing protein n=2 Tax=Candidatus Syntrophocurvum alkaliphilum TaxID=2293317 RepID=A0A6I6DME9_9FIRM|nr:hypothetical protein SYNTR_2293 [Candidatus Syntrophocurvum alkaliphilum]
MARFPFLIITTILSQTLLIAVISLLIYFSNDIETVKSYVPVFIIVIVLLSGFVIISLNQLLVSVRVITERNYLKSFLQNTESLIKILNTERHETSKHIQTIQAMLHLEEYDTAREYTDDIARNYRKLQNIVNVGEPALTALLNSKKSVADFQGIEFDFAVKCDINNIHLKKWELCSIIGNLIDNAFEATTANVNKKRVTLEIKKEDNNYLIYIHNTGEKINNKQINEIFNPGFTTKESDNLGYGLYIVKNIVEKYNGSIKVHTHPKTTFQVSIPVKESHSIA